MPGPILHWMPRVRKDLKKGLAYVGRQPWGKPDKRELDIANGMVKVCTYPEDNRAELRLPESGLWVRHCRVSQFVIVYAYLPSREPSLPDVVSIHAVRHVRVANVFDGVRERSRTTTQTLDLSQEKS